MSIDNLNKKSSILPSSISTKLSERINGLLEYYYCPKCFKVPSIKYDGEYVLIECTCGTKDDIKIQAKNEDVTKKDILIKFTRYKQYKLLIKFFNYKITNLKKFIFN